MCSSDLEWDYRRAGFRKAWCQVQVKPITPVAGTFVSTTLDKYRGLLVGLRRQFEMMSVQEAFVKRQRDGDEIDLDASIEALSDLRAGLSPSDRLFIRLIRPYILASQRHPDAPRLTGKAIEALTWMQDQAEGGAYSVTMDFQPGDMQFINNYHVLHGRTAYEDDRATGRVRG